MSSDSYRLDSLLEITSSKRIHMADYVPSGVPFYRGKEVIERAKGNSVSTELFITQAQYQEIKRKFGSPHDGDILLTSVGTLGVAYFIDGDGDFYFKDGNVTWFRNFDPRVVPKYLYYWLTSPETQKRLDEVSIGSTQRALTISALKSLQVQLPSVDSQRAIVDMLDAVTNRIALLRETNTTLEAIAQALFKSWFVDFDPVRAKMEGRTPEGMDEATAALFPDGFETSELGEVPRGWRWGTLSDLATFQNGYAFKSKDWTDSGHPVVKIGDVKPGIIDLEGCSYVAHETVVGLDRFRLSRGDLLVGMTGYVGATGLVPSVEPAAYLNQRVGRMATKSGVTDLGYLYCAARSPAFKEFAEAQSHGSAQANVSGASLMAFPAVIAPLPLMERFNGAIADVLEVVLTNHEQAQTLSTLRDTLLPHLISGQLRLPETENLIKALIF